ncbi:MAG TPA: hypothetical protein DEF34_08065 [Desulfotomaculum sp.]|nr:hypothetical protein [Desulfotomaculum sp.]
MKLLLATGIETLDRDMAEKMSEDTILGSCYSRNVLHKVIETTGVDTVVISPYLEGECDFVPLVRSARERGVRVVVLPGAPGQSQTMELIKSLAPYGVYDYVFDPVRAEDVMETINSPGNLGQVMRLFEGALELSEFLNKNELGQPFTERPPRPRTGPPHVILAMGNELNERFCNMFSGLIKIVAKTDTEEELKDAVTNLQPDIAVIMRNGPVGGIPDADILAGWASKYVPAVLFIAGELDETGSQMVDRVKDTGVSHILTCPPGGYISGEELVFLMRALVRELQGAETEPSQDTPRDREQKKHEPDGFETLKKRAEKLGNILKPISVEKRRPDRKKTKKLNMKEGLSLEEKPEVTVQSGTGSLTGITPGGLLAVVTPWRPGLAGRIAAHAAKMFAEAGEVAFIAASGHSTGAIWLDVSDDELIMSDWRVPGSQVPVKRDDMFIYAVDPAKNLDSITDSELWDLVKTARKDVTYTVMDLGSDIDAAQKAAFLGRSVVLVIIPGSDPVETKTSQLWLNSLREGKQNIMAGIDLRGNPPAMPEGLEPKVIVRNNPADALDMALRKTDNNEFVWNK